MTGALLLGTILGSCTSDPGDTKIIAHAGTGSGFDHPKNSREALFTALAIGAHGIELDVQMTADSVLVTYHDQYLESLSPCTGLVNSLTWSALKGCPPAIDGRSFQIERVDSLLLEAATLYPDAIFMLDLKLFAHGEWWPYMETFSNALVRFNKIPALRNRALMECMVDDLLLLIQRKAPAIPLFLYGDDPEYIMWRATTSHYTGITINNRNIDANEVEEAQGLGLDVSIMGVRGWWGHRSALKKRPALLQTDSPEDFK